MQKLLFQNPALVPIDEVLPGASGFIPICRELAIPKSGGSSVYLDLFGLTAEARLVLIECKLWRNPQARREVIAQALEYASLLRNWSYSDLSVRLQRALGLESANPLFDTYQKAGGTLDEATFHDRIARALRSGDFLVIIAGDGIREDVLAIAEHLNQNSGMATTLALAEFRIYTSPAGETLILPHVPLRTEVLTHRVYLGPGGEPLTIEAENGQDAEPVSDTDTAIDPTKAERRQRDAAFWQAFCDQAQFDHPDQPPARRGGFGWAKLPMPPPVNHITAYRTARKTSGFFFQLKGEVGRNIYEELKAARPGLEDEIGLPIKGFEHKEDPFRILIELPYPDDPFQEKAYLAWLVENANRVVSALRPFLAQFA